MDPWWTEQQAGLVGGLGGAAIGMVGAMVGSMSFLVVRGKAKPFMVGVFAVMVGLGLVLMAAGVVALVKSQPTHVWSILVLGGFLCAGIFGGLLPVILARYRAADARRMQAEQLRRG